MSACETAKADHKITIDAGCGEPFCHPPLYPNIDGIVHLPGVTQELLNEIKDLPVQEDDVFVATYPKSGTTWLSEIVWQIYFEGKVDMTSILKRVPFIEREKHVHNLIGKDFNVKDFYLKKTFPRFFKTHLPYHLAPLGDGVTKPKFIYVIRNPKDTAVSFYWHYRGMKEHEFNQSWDEFFEMFIKNAVLYGSWFDHVLGWWTHREDTNILILKYEDMKKNLSGAVKQIANFLGKELTLEMIDRITEQTSFTAMSDGKGRFVDGNATETFSRVPGIKFIRKGEIGDWQNYFSQDQNKEFDTLYESKMAGSGLELEFL